MPLISIVITVYNLEKYIEECLDTVLDQDFDDYEIVLVDNGSTDNSVAICEKYQRLNSQRIRFIKLPPPSKMRRAHRAGFEAARGKYVHVIDGDDYLEKNYLCDIAKIIISENPEIIMGTFKCVTEKDAIPFKDIRFEVEKINGKPYNEVVRYFSESPNFFMSFWKYIFKKDLFIGENLFFYNIDKNLFLNDWLPTTKILTKANSIYFYEKPFYYYRRRAGNTVSTGLLGTCKDSPFLTIIEFLAYLSNFGQDSTKRVFILSRVNLLIKMALSFYDQLNFVQLLEIANYFDVYKEYLVSLKNSNDELLTLLYSFINQFGCLDGIVLFCEFERLQVLKNVKNLAEKNIYIFPSGNKSEALVRLLSEAGYNILGFLDNDERKNNKTFNNTTCYTPAILAELTDEEKKSTGIVISTIYSNLNSILQKQVLEYGIDKNNITVV